MTAALPWHRPDHRKAHWNAFERRRSQLEAGLAQTLLTQFKRQAPEVIRAVDRLWATHGSTPSIPAVQHVIHRYIGGEAGRKAIYRAVAPTVGLTFKTEGNASYKLTKSLARAIAYLSTRQDEGDSTDEGFGWEQEALRHLSNRENKITGVSDNRYREIADAVGQVMMDKEYDGGSATVARELARQFGFDRGRALLIARTETTSAAGGATLAGIREGGATKKGWLAVQDDRTRESHAAVDGEVVGVDDPFSNGLLYPGDNAAPPEEVCNCRCTLTPEF